MELPEPKTIYVIGHLFGLALGAGGAFMSDVLFLTTTKDKVLDQSEYKILKTGSLITWSGVILLVISGYLLFSLKPDFYLNSDKFISKIVIVATLIINGFVFHIIHLPKLRKVVGKHLSSSREFIKSSQTLYASGVISVVSWIFTIILGSLKSIPILASDVLILYTLCIVLGVTIAEWRRRKYLAKTT